MLELFPNVAPAAGPAGLEPEADRRRALKATAFSAFGTLNGRWLAPGSAVERAAASLEEPRTCLTPSYVPPLTTTPATTTAATFAATPAPPSTADDRPAPPV